MKTFIASTIVFLGCSGSVLAHTHLEKTLPTDGATLSSAPGELTFQFSEPTRLTATTLQKQGETQGVALKSAAATSMKNVAVTLPSPLTPGTYVVSWRALGADNHVMSGKFRFTIVAR